MATYSNTAQLCKVTTGYRQLTKYSTHENTIANINDMVSDWGLDLKTGASRQLRPLRREETVLS